MKGEPHNHDQHNHETHIRTVILSEAAARRLFGAAVVIAIAWALVYWALGSGQ